MKKIINPNMNKYVISFLIYTFTLFGILGFIFEKTKVDSWTNYYTIFASGAAILLLFLANLSDFKWKNMRKVPFILSLVTILWIIISSFFGIRYGIEVVKGIVNFSCLLALGFVILNISLTEEDRKFIFKSFYISFAICILIGIFQYFSGINLIQYSNSVYPGILGRINSTFFIATILDKYFVLIELLLIYSLIKNPKWYLQLCMILAGVGVSLTFSRSGQLTFILFLLVFLVMAIYKKQVKNVIAIILSILVMYLIPGTALSLQSGLNFVYSKLSLPSVLRLDITFIDDFYKHLGINQKDSSSKEDGTEVEDEEDDEIDAEEDDSFDGDLSLLSREKYKAVGLQLIKDYPIWGVGVGNYSYLYNNQNFYKFITDQSVLDGIDEIRYPHNGFVQVAAEMGYVGLALLCVTLISYLIYVDYKNDKLKIFIAFLLFVALGLACYTETVFNCKQYIFIFVILIGFLSCKNREIVKSENKRGK